MIKKRPRKTKREMKKESSNIWRRISLFFLLSVRFSYWKFIFHMNKAWHLLPIVKRYCLVDSALIALTPSQWPITPKLLYGFPSIGIANKQTFLFVEKIKNFEYMVRPNDVFASCVWIYLNEKLRLEHEIFFSHSNGFFQPQAYKISIYKMEFIIYSQIASRMSRKSVPWMSLESQMYFYQIF